MGYSSEINKELIKWALAYEELLSIEEKGFYNLPEEDQYRLLSELPSPSGLFGMFCSKEMGEDNSQEMISGSYDPKLEFFNESRKFVPTKDQEKLYENYFQEKAPSLEKVQFGVRYPVGESWRSLTSLLNHAELYRCTLR